MSTMQECREVLASLSLQSVSEADDADLQRFAAELRQWRRRIRNEVVLRDLLSGRKCEHGVSFDIVCPDCDIVL